MKRLLLVTMLLTLSFSTNAEPVSGEWNLDLDDFNTSYWHKWSEQEGVLIRLYRTATCGNWKFVVGAMRGKDSTGNESLMARINRLPIHERDFSSIVDFPLIFLADLSDEENASIREGGNIYIKYGNKATLEVPLDVASKHMAEIDRACDKEKEVWD